jgi:phage shock protein A
MAILDRVGTLLRANISDLLDRAEDPEKMIKQLLQDMENQLIQVKTQVAASIADQQRLKERWEENQRQADEWQRKAELAVQKGQDDLAKEALSRRNTYQQTSVGFKEQYEEQSRQVEQLKDALDRLESKIQEARTKKDLLIARHRRAAAERQINQTMARVDTSGVMGGFERMEEKVRGEEARAKALSDMDRDTLDERFKVLEEEDEVDKQLRELKSQLGPGSTNQASLPSGGSASGSPSSTPGSGSSAP